MQNYLYINWIFCILSNNLLQWAFCSSSPSRFSYNCIYTLIKSVILFKGTQKQHGLTYFQLSRRQTPCQGLYVQFGMQTIWNYGLFLMMILRHVHVPWDKHCLILVVSIETRFVIHLQLVILLHWTAFIMEALTTVSVWMFWGKYCNLIWFPWFKF